MKKNEEKSDADVLKDVLGNAESMALFGDGVVNISKERLQQILGKCSTLEEAHQYLVELTQRHNNLEILKDRILGRLKRWGLKNENSRLIFHAAFMEPELGEMHYISNLSEVSSDDMAELMFRNCQMSRVFCEAVFKTCQLCKKAGVTPASAK